MRHLSKTGCNTTIVLPAPKSLPILGPVQSCKWIKLKATKPAWFRGVWHSKQQAECRSYLGGKKPHSENDCMPNWHLAHFKSTFLPCGSFSSKPSLAISHFLRCCFLIPPSVERTPREEELYIWNVLDISLAFNHFCIPRDVCFSSLSFQTSSAGEIGTAAPQPMMVTFNLQGH